MEGLPASHSGPGGKEIRGHVPRDVRAAGATKEPGPDGKVGFCSVFECAGGWYVRARVR